MIILSIGTNIGDRERNIENAVKALGEIGKVGAISPIYTSEPWGFESENGFYNIALILESDLSPLDLLRETQRIEKELGRTAKTTTEYADRVIDIDIIDYDNQIIDYRVQSADNSSLLTLPHPLMHLRNFVLYPLADIAPKWVHPILKLTTLEL
ncbi:MAG: 2-amino-4-hydroxy-6-hydroxymethyldihydropteridine diphosphokinase, partial [Paludibacteraceae bacterium]|nr:2-amino-4-hydroxy-6-hydroxymethyldihydropteridine diphosphokinase [Paludibacteraceae bacterium]